MNSNCTGRPQQEHRSRCAQSPTSAPLQPAAARPIHGICTGQHKGHPKISLCTIGLPSQPPQLVQLCSLDLQDFNAQAICIPACTTYEACRHLQYCTGTTAVGVTAHFRRCVKRRVLEASKALSNLDLSVAMTLRS